jgi:hypothetical protein
VPIALSIRPLPDIAFHRNARFDGPPEKEKMYRGRGCKLRVRYSAIGEVENKDRAEHRDWIEVDLAEFGERKVKRM